MAKQILKNGFRNICVYLTCLGLLLSAALPMAVAYEPDEGREKLKQVMRDSDLSEEESNLLNEEMQGDEGIEGEEPEEADLGEESKEDEKMLEEEELAKNIPNISSLEQMFEGKASLDLSRSIKQFGYDIFQASSTFAPVQNVPVGPDYVIGSGDSLIVYIWGKVVQETFNVKVDRDGKITLPKSGNIYVWGLKFSEVEKLIKNTLAQHYANLQISVTMGRLRSIKVFVLGDVTRPGAYTMSSLSTVFHSIYEAGGPTKLGSMRFVKLIRNNETIDTIDLYNFLLEGDKSQDHKLLSNDTIFVPSIGRVAGVAGRVKRPGIYEITQDVKMSELIKMSGGLTPEGYVQRIQLERIQERQRRVVIDLKLKDIDELENSQEDIAIQDGDLVLIFSILPEKYNFVSVSGNVFRPGDYEFTAQMRVKDLLDNAGGISVGTYLERAELFRYKDDRSREVIPVNLKVLLQGKDEKENLLLQDWDDLVVYAKSDVLPERYVQISGAIYKPGEYELTSNMKINDLIFRAGNLKQTASLANAELFRVGNGEGTKIYSLDLSKKIGGDSCPYKILLHEDDHLYIREEKERREKRIITLKGEVKFPGEYVAAKDESLSSIVKRAGGFTKEAFLKGAVFTRESVKEVQQQMVDRFIASEKKSLLQLESKLEKSDISQAEQQEKETTFQRRKELVELVSSIEVVGRMVIDLKDPYELSGTQSDVVIEDEDILYVPPVPSSVQIVGSVYNPTSVVFETEKTMKYYLKKAGGFTKNADKKSIYIVRANGEVESEFVRIQEVDKGDTIVVPEEFKTKTQWGKLWLDTTQIMYNMAVGAAVVLD
ncbi:MAG: hypothetical protein GY853_11665 [PVC group bacterium]|nr:hypothetical protein [PVC group bacterium]